jgi:two-component system, sensor histidine kinase and response regulator
MKTILLIDDDQQLRMVFGLALRQGGYNVIEAESGDAGLQMARQHLPDLILSDIHMPGGDGSTLLRDIRRDSELKSKQVVLMTGRPELVTARKGMEEGADDFLVKPISLASLLNCVKARFSRASISWRVEDDTVAQLRSLVPSNLPHEFFTPLTGIIGLMEVLRSDPTAFSPAEINDIYKDIYNSALRLNRTARNYLFILDLQTPPASPVTVQPPREVDRFICAGVRDALRLNPRREDVTIDIKPCSLEIKTEDLVLIVEELVDNACKFSRQGTPVKITMGTDGRLVVSDMGRGLTAQQIDQIGAFQQFDRKKQEQQGLGLGLVLVKKLTSRYKAEFSIKSHPGEGTQVEIAFPVTKLSGIVTLVR